MEKSFKIMFKIVVAMWLVFAFTVLCAWLCSCKTQKHLQTDMHTSDSTVTKMVFTKQGNSHDSTTTIKKVDTSKNHTTWNYQKQIHIQKRWDTVGVDSSKKPAKPILKPVIETWITEWGNIEKAQKQAQSEQQTTTVHNQDTGSHQKNVTTGVHTNDQHTNLDKKSSTKTGQIMFWILAVVIAVVVWYFWPYLVILFRRRKNTTN